MSGRWACGKGHFIAEASVKSEDYRDDGSYYGVSSRTTGHCNWCGTVQEPRYVVIPSLPCCEQGSEHLCALHGETPDP